ncbi:MAG: hypoxanthine phosphoribosyltransferase [Candidatus Hydrogenedentes bacterium]|nr:hypoxanthine phosphoribosyltransferase [Candidatus Hydrogenedentota bacterium]
MKLSKTPLITAEEIRERVELLARQISIDYAGKDLVFLIVLKGATIFGSDLMRQLSIPVTVDYLRARSYRGTNSTGHVEITLQPEEHLAGRHVLIVEDILDTGFTTSAIREALRALNPASLRICTLLDKPAPRVADIHADYVGFSVDNIFVVGYGLDCDGAHRHLAAIYMMESTT